MREVVIVSAVRTPIGTYGKGLMPFSAVDLGVIAAKGAIEKAGIDVKEIDEVIMGNVLGAGLGQNVARQIGVKSGLDVEVPAMTINKVCGSGLRTISLAAQIIGLGDADCILCGGTESMSNAPYLMPNGRWGQRMGDGKLIDYMVHDGLTDIFNGYHMGITAENIVDQWKLTRDELDEFAVSSQNKAEAAQKAGKFKDEIIPVVHVDRKGRETVIADDEYPRHGATVEGMAKLRPAFKKDGAVTAGNSSGINDGASCLIVMSKEKADALGLKYMAKVAGYGSKGLDPSIMGYGPVPSVKAALEKYNWSIEDIELAELNEAFAAQSVAVVRDLGINPDIVNVNGGAIALGHPIGSSGARIVVTLLHEMEKRDAKKGVASLCIGGGMGTTLLVERV